MAIIALIAPTMPSARNARNLIVPLPLALWAQQQLLSVKTLDGGFRWLTSHFGLMGDEYNRTCVRWQQS